MTFDLEKARDLAKNPIHCPETDEVFRNAIAEIERLRAKVGKMEFLMRSTDDTCLACAIKLEVVELQAARIQELEDALVEERAKRKIGPDDSKKISHLRPYEVVAADLAGMLAKSWRITDERKAAFVWILRRLEYDQSLPGHTYYKIQQAMELLRAMLDEAGQ